MSDPVADHASVAIERFDRGRHDIDAFASGNQPLDGWLHQQRERDEQERTAVTYVLVDPAGDSAGKRVIGYLTLNSFAFPGKQARRRDQDRHIGRYDPVPAVLIGRLALDASFQGRGLGSVLIVSALTQILAIRDRLGIAVAVVHAIDDAAASFYEHQGFTRFRDNPRHLYYLLATFERALDE
jgi:GNAT superfamily N-acetyltransferase